MHILSEETVFVNRLFTINQLTNINFLKCPSLEMTIDRAGLSKGPDYSTLKRQSTKNRGIEKIDNFTPNYIPQHDLQLCS